MAPIPFLLALAALISSVAASGRGRYTYSCVQTSILGYDELECPKYTDKASCLGAVAIFWEDGEPATSCSWRRVDTRTGDITDTHYYFSNAEWGGFSFVSGSYDSGDPRFGDFYTLETKIELPRDSSGYNAMISVIGGLTYMESYCSVGDIPGRDCEIEVTLPYGAVPDTDVNPSFISTYYLIPTSASSGQISIMATNTFKMKSNARKRLASSSGSRQPWFRFSETKQVQLGWPTLVSNGGDLNEFYNFDFRYLDLGIEAIEVELEVRRSKARSISKTGGPPIYAYVIEDTKLFSWYETCDFTQNLCDAPVAFAAASCTATGKKCEFKATLDPYVFYTVIVSKPVIGYTAKEDPVIVSYEIDADYQSTALYASTLGTAQTTSQAERNTLPFNSYKYTTTKAFMVPAT